MRTRPLLGSVSSFSLLIVIAVACDSAPEVIDDERRPRGEGEGEGEGEGAGEGEGEGAGEGEGEGAGEGEGEGAGEGEGEGEEGVTVTSLNNGDVRRCPGDGDFNQCVRTVSGIVTSPVVRISDGNVERGPIFGFYLGDPGNIAAGRFGPQSGVLVLARPGNTREPVTLEGYAFDNDDRFWAENSPAIGDTVELVGDNAENFGQGALRNVTFLKKTGTAAVPQPALFGTGGRDPAELKGGRPTFADGDFVTGFEPPLEGVAAATNIKQWENVLVELRGVTTTTACYAQPFRPSGSTDPAFARDFSNFLVTGDVEVGSQFFLPQAFGGFFDTSIPVTERTCENRAQKCQDSRVDGQAFTSLVGIINFSFDVHRLNPRSALDIDATPGFVQPGTGNCP
jgi:hypothetical protein